jgi:AcrR family transcriptional regulator
MTNIVSVSPRPYQLGQREAASAQTRARILDAARRLLGQEGGSGSFSIDAVAREADVARMTVYHQFTSKLGLLEALFDDLARRGGLDRMPAVFTQADPVAALEEFVAVFCGFWQSDRTALRRLRAAAALDPELQAALRSRDERRRRGLRVLAGRLTQARGGEDSVADDTVDLLEALTGFETFDLLAETRRPAEVAAVVLRGARAILGPEPA